MVLYHKIFLYLGILILLNACTVQKRLHQKGYYVAFNGNYKSPYQYQYNNSSTENKILEINKTSPELTAETISETANNSDNLKNEFVLLNTLQLKIDSPLVETLVLNETFKLEEVVTSKKETSNSIKKEIRPLFFNNNSALFYAFLAHFGVLVMLVGFILYFMTIIDLGLIIFMIFGITFNLLGTLGGAIDLFFGRAVPDILPLFTKVSIIGYGLFWLIGILGIGVLAAIL